MKRIRHRLMFMTAPTDGDPAGGGSTTQGTEENAGQSTADDASTTSASADQGDPEKSEPNWQAKFEAQQKINRDMERKLKGEAGTLNATVAELRAKLEGKEQEHAEALKQRQVEEAALAKANDRIRKAEVRAAAAGKLSDPADALRFLNLEDFEVSADGEVDASAVSEAIEALVKSKPYLAAEGGAGPTIHSPTANREGSTGKRQWTKADMQGKTPEQINAARDEGLLKDLLAGTS